MKPAAAPDYPELARLLLEAPMHEQMWAMASQDLHEYFMLRAVSAPAWPKYTAGEGKPEGVSGWILPGAYTMGELENRLAPRADESLLEPDPGYQVIAERALEAVSAATRRLLMSPEQEQLVDRSAVEGLDFESLHQHVLDSIGAAVVCAQLSQDLRDTVVTLTPDYLRDAGRRRARMSINDAQERQALQRRAHADQERYGKLLKKWQTVSGDLYGVHLTEDSPLTPILMTWLRTLDLADVAAFLGNYHPSARVQVALCAPELAEAARIASEAAPLADCATYNKLRQLIDVIMNIEGYRRLTIANNDNKYVQVDIDQFNRVGLVESHLGFLTNCLYTGLLSKAGVMVRAFQATTVNVFQPDKGAYSEVAVKHLYGALLEKNEMYGLTARQVEAALTKEHKPGEAVPREASVRCLDWPKS